MRGVVWYFIATCVAALAVVGSFNLALWYVDQDPPIRYEDARALTSTVQQGGTIEVQFTVFRGRICPVLTKRWLYDSAEAKHSIPQFTVGMQLLAGRETYRRAITVPTSASVGPARYEVTLDYTCNPLQRLIGPIRVVSPPIHFIVKPTAKATGGSQVGGDG